MEENKISVDLQLNTSEFGRGIKDALRILSDFEKNIEEKTNIDINSKNFQKSFQNISKTATKEIQKINDEIERIAGKDAEIKVKLDIAKAELEKLKGIAAPLNELAKHGLQKDEAAKANANVEKAQVKVDAIQNQRTSNDAQLVSKERELESVFADLEKIRNLDFNIDSDKLAVVYAYLQNISNLIDEEDDDEEDVNDELDEQVEKQKEVTKETKKTGKELRKNHHHSNAISRLIARVGMSIRRQIVTRIASILNPLNMMQKAFDYLTNTLSPRLGATFKNIGENLTEYFASSPLFKTIINQLLYIISLLQNAFNAMAKLLGFRQIDLFKKSAKSAKETAKAANQTTASFDEINDIGNSGGGGNPEPYSLGELDLKDNSGEIIDSINNIIKKIQGFVSEIDFKKLGEDFGKKLSDLFLSIDWENLARILANLLTGVFDFAWGMIVGVDWGGVAKKISDTLLAFITEIGDWLKNVDWNQLATDLMTAINDFVTNIDYNSIFKTLFEALGNAIGGIGVLIGNFVAALGVMIVDYFKQYINIEEGDSWLDIGDKIIGGILKGILNALASIGTWIWDNIFIPLWEGIKNAFGIHSPSTKMIEIGLDLIAGLKEGLLGIWESIKNIFINLGTNIVNKFTEIWNNIKSVFSIEKFKTHFTQVLDGIKSVFKKIPEWFKDKFTTAWTNVKNVFSSGGKIFSGIKEGIASTFKTIVNKLISGINKVISVPFNAINKMLNKIHDIEILGVEPFKKLWSRDPLKVPQIPSLDVGTNYVPNDQLAMIHQGEAIIPKKFNEKEFFGTNNEETNALLEQLIERVENIELNPYIQVKDIGEASINYINNKSRITGRSVI